MVGVSPIIYNLQLSTLINFATTILNINTTDSYYVVSSALAAGIKCARLRVYDGLNKVTSWSSTLIFTVDNTPPSQVVLISPSNGTCTDAYLISFAWMNATDNCAGTAYYQIQISDVSAGFPSPLYVNTTTYSSSY